MISNNKYIYKPPKIEFNSSHNDSSYKKTTNPNLADIIFYHENCPDGTLSCALWLKQITGKKHIYPIQPSTNVLLFFPFKNFIRYSKINIVFLDVVPSDIIKFCNKILDYNKMRQDSHITITIVDHHVGNIDKIKKLKKLSKTDIIINFEPNSLYGAAKQVIDQLGQKILGENISGQKILGETILSKKQIEFSIPIAAMDMWNRDAFKDVNYLNFGLKYYCFKNNIKMFTINQFDEMMDDGIIPINYFVDIGKKWYAKTYNYIVRLFSTARVNRLLQYNITFEEYNIVIVDLAKIFNKGEYMKQKSNMVVTLSFMLEDKFIKNRLLGSNVNTIAFLNSGGVSLRSIDNNKKLDMNYLADKLCKGGGHVKAAGCNAELFLKAIVT